MTVVLGDFLHPARENISAAVACRWPPPDSVPAVANELSRVIAVLGTCLGDNATPDSGASGIDRAQAARETARDRLALRQSALVLRKATADPGRMAPAGDLAAASLAAAADQLAAGRDLLQARRFPAVLGRDGTAPALAGVTYWAGAASSAPASAAMLAEIRGHIRVLAPWATGLSAVAGRTPAGLALHDAARWLYAASGTHDAWAQDQAVPDEARGYLYRLPLPLLPPRRRPGEHEDDTDLCAGIIDTSTRLRHAAVEFLPHASSSPAANSLSWRRHALAISITTHASKLILDKLTRRAQALGASPALLRKYRQARDAAASLWPRQRLLTADWDKFTTGARPHAELTPVAAEIDDLVTRIGRLAYDNPLWAPGMSAASRERHPADTARTPEDLAAVLTAVHHAADAIAVITAADRQSIREAASGARIHYPAAWTPRGRTAPYHYAPCSRARAFQLVTSYEAAARSATSLAAELDDLACTLATPSSILATPRRKPLPPPGGHLNTPHELSGPIPVPRAGQVTNLLGQLRITEPAILARAELADAAALDLIAEADELVRRRWQSNPLSGRALDRP